MGAVIPLCRLSWPHGPDSPTGLALYEPERYHPRSAPNCTKLRTAAEYWSGTRCQRHARLRLTTNTDNKGPRRPRFQRIPLEFSGTASPQWTDLSTAPVLPSCCHTGHASRRPLGDGTALFLN